MKKIFPPEVERGRVKEGPLKSPACSPFGAFYLTRGGVSIVVVASDGEGWDHVSVSTEFRCPTWQEMHWVKQLFFNDDEAAMQLHPAKKDYRNCHPYCLHMWRPQRDTIPLPPAHMVAPDPR